jgi:hypothetical protein
MAKTSQQRSSTPKAPKSTVKANTPPAPNAGEPVIRYRNLAVAGLVFVALWGLAIASRSKGTMIVLGIVTVLIAGFGFYVWRWYQKQKAIMDLAKRANESPEARRAAIEELKVREGADDDVMNTLMRAQLELQEDPERAMATFESIDMKKVPAMMQNEVRGMKAQVYLARGRVDEAASLCDQIKLTEIQQAEVRVMMAATSAEAWARTDRVKAARDLLEMYSPEDATYASAKVPLLFARVFANAAERKAPLVRKDLLTLCRENPQYLARFVDPAGKVSSDLQQAAAEVLRNDPGARKMISEMASSGSAPLNRAQRRAMK